MCHIAIVKLGIMIHWLSRARRMRRWDRRASIRRKLFWFDQSEVRVVRDVVQDNSNFFVWRNLRIWCHCSAATLHVHKQGHAQVCLMFFATATWRWSVSYSEQLCKQSSWYRRTFTPLAHSAYSLPILSPHPSLLNAHKTQYFITAWTWHTLMHAA